VDGKAKPCHDEGVEAIGRVNMVSITIRNLDPKLLEKLKIQAKANGRSLQAELHGILNRSIAIVTPRHAFLATADRIAAMTPKMPQTDSAILLREDRDR
jgi:plasmid stability protein